VTIASLKVWGRDLLAMDLGWFPFAPMVNAFAMIRSGR